MSLSPSDTLWSPFKASRGWRRGWPLSWAATTNDYCGWLLHLGFGLAPFHSILNLPRQKQWQDPNKQAFLPQSLDSWASDDLWDQPESRRFWGWHQSIMSDTRNYVALDFIVNIHLVPFGWFSNLPTFGGDFWHWIQNAKVCNLWICLYILLPNFLLILNLKCLPLKTII